LGWTSSQTIYVRGHANRQSTIDTGWKSELNPGVGDELFAWDKGCEAVIKYWNGSSYQ